MHKLHIDMSALLCLGVQTVQEQQEPPALPAQRTYPKTQRRPISHQSFHDVQSPERSPRQQPPQHKQHMRPVGTEHWEEPLPPQQQLHGSYWEQQQRQQQQVYSRQQAQQEGHHGSIRERGLPYSRGVGGAGQEAINGLGGPGQEHSRPSSGGFRGFDFASERELLRQQQTQRQPYPQLSGLLAGRYNQLVND